MIKLIKKIRCLFYNHIGALKFDEDKRRYYVECKHCGNKGEGYCSDT